MAFRDYALSAPPRSPNIMPRMPRGVYPRIGSGMPSSGKGFAQYAPADTSELPGFMHLARVPNPKDVAAIQKDQAEIDYKNAEAKKIPTEIERNQAETAAHNATATKVNEETAQKQRDRDMIMKIVLGNVGSNAKSEKDFKGVLDSSTTGYQDPGADKLTKMGLSPMEYAAVLKKNAEGKAQYPDTDRAIAEAQEYLKANPDSDPHQVMASVLNNKKADPNDPRWNQFKSTPEASSGDGAWDKIKSFFKGAVDSNAPSESEIAALGRAPSPAPSSLVTPDNRPNPPQAGETRIFTDPGTLPDPGKFQEGSYLNTNGQRTHVLQGGKWQPITQ